MTDKVWCDACNAFYGPGFPAHFVDDGKAHRFAVPPRVPDDAEMAANYAVITGVIPREKWEELEPIIRAAVNRERESIALWHEERADIAEKAAKEYYSAGSDADSAFKSALSRVSVHRESARAIRAGTESA